MKNNLSRHLGLALLVGGSAFGLLQADSAKALFKLNCASCHGEDGRGDTAVGKALKARNFLTEPFKQGDSVEAIFKTIKTGVPGTAMVGYGYLKQEDRQALAQYVHSLRQKAGDGEGQSTTKVEAPKTTPNPVSTPVQPETAEKKVSQPVSAPIHTKNTVEKVVEAVKTLSEKPTEVKASNNVIPSKSNEGGEDPRITLGRQVYKLQGCNSCHGDNGQADTPTGMALKARNFVLGDYKHGGDVAGIKKVLKNGIAGSAMIAYPQIQGEELESLATFLLALKGNPDIATDPDPQEASGSGKVSISYAMELMAEHERAPLKWNFDKSSLGGALYAAKCSECHGENGQGGVSIRMISSAPYYRVKTQPILGHDGDWMKRATFDKLVTEGLPGRLKPGLGTITKADLDALYDFFVESQKAVK